MNYEENQAFMRAIEKADSFYIEGKFPVPIKDMIRDDDEVQLFTFGEFARLAGVKRSEVAAIGQSDEAFHFKKAGKSFIVYNALKSVSRQRFTLAHEYGHIKLNHAGKSLYDRGKELAHTHEKNMRLIRLQAVYCSRYISAMNIGRIALMR